MGIDKRQKQGQAEAEDQQEVVGEYEELKGLWLDNPQWWSYYLQSKTSGYGQWALRALETSSEVMGFQTLFKNFK